MKFYKILPLSLLLAAQGMAYEDDEFDDYDDEYEEEFIAYEDQSSSSMQMMHQQSPSSQPLYNAPVVAAPNGWGVSFRAEALLWQAVEENLTYGYQGSAVNDTPVVRDIKTVHFDWDWGFLLGAGWNIARDRWRLNFNWTHILNQARGKIHSGNESLYELYVNAADVNFTGSSFSSHWRNHLDQLDLDLSRAFLVSKHLEIQPYIGIRNAWIRQRYKIHYKFSAAPEQKVDLVNHFWGIGFAGGVASDWRLGAGFSFYGDVGAAILLGFFDIDQRTKLDNSTIWKIDKSFRAGRPILDLSIGLKWMRAFIDEQLALTLKMGYDYHLYFNQNQFVLTNGNSNFELFNPVGGDLSYQGVTFAAQLDF